ncbi:major tail subunit [Cronobacter phage EspYZU05]|uniref:Major tail subunit n=1 Tax=Cronobacter phage EspYZU05 TaxID=2836139 RepID=A0AA47NE87_9CAUD|nr:major tail subunit [Cronobacter phage EspYZU05]
MFVHEAPFLGAVSGAGQLRRDAVRLQCYAEVNTGAQPDVLAFWEAQLALADKDHGLPYDGTYVPGVIDLRPACYKVLSHYRMFNPAGIQDYKDFCTFFIEKNGGGQPAEPLSFSKNLSGSNASDADGTYVPAGSTYTNSVEVTGGVAPYTYAWFKRSGGVDQPVGSDQNSYDITNYQSTNNGDYFVRVTDAAGTTIESTRDRTRVAVRITKQPVATLAVDTGGTITLSATVDGGYQNTFQWYKDGVALSGRTGASFTKSNAVAEDAGSYHVVVTSANTRGPKTAESTACAVTVNPPAEG